MLTPHTPDTADGYKRPVFSRRNKLRRLLWNISWLLLCQWTPKPLHTWRVWVLRRFGAIIGKQNAIYPNCIIWAPWLLETEDVVTIGPQAEVYNPGGVYLGHHVILSQGSFLCGATHDYNSPDFTYIKEKIVLKPYVWICARATVLAGVHCEEGSVLGAMALAARNLDAWTVYTGNPARPVKKRRNLLLMQSMNVTVDEQE